MTSSKASYMLVSLLLVLVLADMDKALGEQIQLRNRKLGVIPTGWLSNPKNLPAWFKKGQDLVGAIPSPPPSLACNINDDVCKRKLKKAYDLWKAKSPPSPSRSSKGKHI